MKVDLGLDENLNAFKLGPHEAIINIFSKILFTNIGSDFFSPKEGTNIMNATSEDRIRIEIVSAIMQTKNIINNNTGRYGKIILLNDIKILGIALKPGSVTIYLDFIFSDRRDINTSIEVPQV